MLMRLTLALTMLAPPSQEAADAAYNDGEFRKAFDLFLEAAADSNVHRPDALHGAHASLIALHEETGETEHLCRALALARELLANGSFADDDERAAWVELEARDVDKMQRAKVTCTAAPSTTTPTEAAKEPPGTLTVSAPDEDPLLPVVSRSPARPTKRPAPVGRGLTIAGGVTLAAGLGLTGAAGYLGGSMLHAWRDSRALHEETGPLGTQEQADKDAALARDYQRLRAPMLATALVGVSALVVGAALTAVGAKRLARAASRAALLPMPGGLVLRTRF